MRRLIAILRHWWLDRQIRQLQTALGHLELDYLDHRACMLAELCHLNDRLRLAGKESA